MYVRRQQIAPLFPSLVRECMPSVPRSSQLSCQGLGCRSSRLALVTYGRLIYITSTEGLSRSNSSREGCPDKQPAHFTCTRTVPSPYLPTEVDGTSARSDTGLLHRARRTPRQDTAANRCWLTMKSFRHCRKGPSCTVRLRLVPSSGVELARAPPGWHRVARAPGAADLAGPCQLGSKSGSDAAPPEFQKGDGHSG